VDFLILASDYYEKKFNSKYKLVTDDQMCEFKIEASGIISLIVWHVKNIVNGELEKQRKG
jgi:hypothetical protein